MSTCIGEVLLISCCRFLSVDVFSLFVGFSMCRKDWMIEKRGFLEFVIIFYFYFCFVFEE